MRVVIYAALLLLLPCLAHGQNYSWSQKSLYSTFGLPIKIKHKKVIQAIKNTDLYLDTIHSVKRYVTTQISTEYSTTHKVVTGSVLNVEYIKEDVYSQPLKILIWGLDYSDDTLKYNTSMLYRAKGELADEVYISLDSPITLTQKELREMYLDKKSVTHAFMFGAEYSLGWASRVLTINRPDKTTQQMLNQRNQTERFTSGSKFAAKLGYAYKRNHNFYLGYYRIKQGFQSDGTIVDFYSSNSTINPASNSYIFRYWGGEIGYRYSGSKRNFNPVFDVGFGVQKLQSKEYTILQFINQETASLKIGVGFNYRPGVFRNNVELYVVPTFYKNLKAVDYGPIKTNLHYFGINSGLAFYIHN